jgi:hypothetical protein
MQGGGRARPQARAAGWLGASALAIVLAGCNPAERPGIAAGSARGASIAVESIEGAPAAVSRLLEEQLSVEAAARQIAMTPRAGAADFRMRGYLAAGTDRGRPQLAWVWDVYDSEKRRTLRISGSEPAARRGRDPWAAADAETLRRIARASVEQLAGFLDAGTAGTRAPAPTDPPPGETVAAALSGERP